MKNITLIGLGKMGIQVIFSMIYTSPLRILPRTQAWRSKLEILAKPYGASPWE